MELRADPGYSVLLGRVAQVLLIRANYPPSELERHFYFDGNAEDLHEVDLRPAIRWSSENRSSSRGIVSTNKSSASRGITWV